jgi:hypothetical protein
VDGNVSCSRAALISGHATMEFGSAFGENIMLDASTTPSRVRCGSIIPPTSAAWWAGFDGNNVLDLVVSRVFKSFDEIVDHCCYVWNMLIDQP